MPRQGWVLPLFLTLMFPAVSSAQTPAVWNALLMKTGSEWLAEAEDKMRSWPYVDSSARANEESEMERDVQQAYRSVAVAITRKLIEARHSILGSPFPEFEQSVGRVRAMRDHLEKRPS